MRIAVAFHYFGRFVIFTGHSITQKTRHHEGRWAKYGATGVRWRCALPPVQNRPIAVSNIRTGNLPSPFPR
ncbi:hypothetical protein KCP78_14390 [Salmonella enterica subsp. enterica]|nr:hypothetical protein KCP78_14390 [Salmonella enterica subsp. enterica]